MKKFEEPIDQITEKLLCDFGASIIRRIAAVIKVDPDELSLLVAGLIHDHWFIADEFVEGCRYCERIEQFNRTIASGVSLTRCLPEITPKIRDV